MGAGRLEGRATRLTLNLGLRYDVTTNGFANDAAFPPFVESGRPDDTNNMQPRLGFAYQLNDRTVLRGGTGIYFGDAISPDVNWMYGNTQIATIQIQNDGRADFATNPFNGRPLPTYAQAQQLFCHVNQRASGVWKRRPRNSRHRQNSRTCPARGSPPSACSDWSVTTLRSRPITSTAHVVNEKQVQQNINLTYNEATGANNPFSNRSLRAFPKWGVVSMSFHQGLSNYHGLQMALTKRFSNRWQGSATYTVSALRNQKGCRTAASLRWRSTWRRISATTTAWRSPISATGWSSTASGTSATAFQLSGLYFYGSGERYDTSYGGDLRDIGADASNRLRPDGSIVPRNDFVGDAVHRVDLRVQKRFRFGSRMATDGIVGGAQSLQPGELRNLHHRGKQPAVPCSPT